MPSKTIQILGPVLVPVGHDVEITWFEVEKVSVGLLGGEKKETEPIGVPLVVDLDTEIRYGFYAHYVDGSYRASAINVPKHRLRSDLRVREKVRGTVTHCSLINIGFEGRNMESIETEIVIEVE